MSLNGLNILQGERFSRKELIDRLTKMKVLFNDSLSQKSYFVDKYDEHIQDKSKLMMILDKLIRDNEEEKRMLLIRKERRTRTMPNESGNSYPNVSKFSVSKQDEGFVEKERLTTLKTSFPIEKRENGVVAYEEVKDIGSRQVIEQRLPQMDSKPKQIPNMIFIKPKIQHFDTTKYVNSFSQQPLIVHDKYDNQIPYEHDGDKLAKGGEIHHSIVDIKPYPLKTNEDKMNLPNNVSTSIKPFEPPRRCLDPHQNNQSIFPRNSTQTAQVISQDDFSNVDIKHADSYYKYVYIILGTGTLLMGAYYCVKYNPILLDYFKQKIAPPIGKDHPPAEQSSFQAFFESISSGFAGFKGFIRSPLKAIGHAIAGFLWTIGTKYFLGHIQYWIAVFVIRLLAYYTWRKIKNRSKVKAIFEEIKAELLRISKESDDIYAGLTENDIIKRYASAYGYSEIEFQRQIMPKLRALRANDDSIKEYEEFINGKMQRLWQWSS